MKGLIKWCIVESSLDPVFFLMLTNGPDMWYDSAAEVGKRYEVNLCVDGFLAISVLDIQVNDIADLYTPDGQGRFVLTCALA